MSHEAEIRDDFHPLFYDELGRLAVAVGRIEYRLKLCIKDLKGEGFTSGMLFAEKLKSFSTLCDKAMELSVPALEEPSRSAFRAVVEEIKSLGDGRNDMIHAMWTVTTGRVALRVRPERKKGSDSVNWKKTRPVTINELTDLRMTVEAAFSVLEEHRRSWKKTRRKSSS